MNRQIKFRAWNTSHIKPIMEVFQWYELHSIERLRDEIIMQFTGLLDKNGREIYEGDILTDDFNSIAFVVWYDTYAQFRLDYGEDDIHLFDGQHNEMTVIGNIYENPEILQTQN